MILIPVISPNSKSPYYPHSKILHLIKGVRTILTIIFATIMLIRIIYLFLLDGSKPVTPMSLFFIQE